MWCTITFFFLYIFIYLFILIYRYNKINIQTFLHISTLLDPRFKDFPMNEGEEHLPTIKQELMKMVKAEGSVTYDSKLNSSTDVGADLPKKGRISG